MQAGGWARTRAPPDSVCVCVQQVNRLDITADKQILAAAGNPSVRLYDIPTLNQNQSHVR